VRKTKPTSTQPCSFCKARATWRTNGLSFMKHACDEHQPQLREYEKQNQDDGHMSEADHQTWGRF
jgi:hypothetical protein